MYGDEELAFLLPLDIPTVGIPWQQRAQSHFSGVFFCNVFTFMELDMLGQ